MDLCDQCGNKSLMPEHYSDVCLCKKCSMKLLSSTWKNKEYDSNEEIDRQMEKVIKLAGKYSYSPKVIEGLSSFFSSKKIDGLYRKFSGGCGQKIIVCSDRLIIKTEADFDIKERLIKGCVQEKEERLELVIMFPLSRQRKLFLWLLEI